MKIRALLLITIMISGIYVMLQSYEDYNEKEFTELIDSTNTRFSSLVFTKPSTIGSTSKTWTVVEESEIENLLSFLQNYHVRKLKPEEIDPYDEIDQFSINLQDENGNVISLILNEDVIIQNSMLYYEIVDGPLNVDWLVQFFVSNQKKSE